MEPLVHIHADESCLGVQFTDRDSPGGAGGVVEHWKNDRWHRRDYWVSESATTNNRMALRSAIEGLELMRGPCRIVFRSDSQYLVKGYTEWLPGWIARGWKRKSGAIENETLWRELAEVSSRHQIEWRWTRGHAGDPHNEYANHLATRAARKQDESSGLVPSGFEEWLEKQREQYARYFEFNEHAPPSREPFRPAPTPSG